MTRILFTDTPTDLQREILDLLISTTESAIKYGKVGMKFSELHRYAANKLGKYKKYFTHSLGHGVGRDIHELPNVSPRRHGNIRE